MFAFAAAEGAGATVEVSADEPKTGVVLAFEIPMARIAGRVVAPDGSAAPGIEVAITASVPSVAYLAFERTDAEGRFAFDVPLREEPYGCRAARLGESTSSWDPPPWELVRCGDEFFRSDVLPAETAYERRFSLERETTIRGLAPGCYRFLAFPPDVAFDPPCVTIDAATEVVGFRARQLEGEER